jgi:hypothetical protein
MLATYAQRAQGGVLLFDEPSVSAHLGQVHASRNNDAGGRVASRPSRCQPWVVMAQGLAADDDCIRASTLAVHSLTGDRTCGARRDELNVEDRCCCTFSSHEPVTHAEWPVLDAILPSRVMAYFHTENGRPVTALWSKASFTRSTASHAADKAGSAAATSGDITSTAKPAACNAAMAQPRSRGSGCGKPITTRATPAPTRASTADRSPAHSPCTGSKLTKAAGQGAVSRAKPGDRRQRGSGSHLCRLRQNRWPASPPAPPRECLLVRTGHQIGNEVKCGNTGVQVRDVPGRSLQAQLRACRAPRNLRQKTGVTPHLLPALE